MIVCNLNLKLVCNQGRLQKFEAPVRNAYEALNLKNPYNQYIVDDLIALLMADWELA
jgi:hypothetical protein